MTINNGRVGMYCSCGGDESDRGITLTLNYNTVNGQIIDVNGFALTVVNECSAPGHGHLESPTGAVIFDGPIPVGTTAFTRQQLNAFGINNRGDYRNMTIGNG